MPALCHNGVECVVALFVALVQRLQHAQNVSVTVAELKVVVSSLQIFGFVVDVPKH